MKTTLNPTALTILSVLLERPFPSPSIRELCRRTGKTRHGIHVHLLRLRRFGLVTWDDRCAGTLRATCTYEPAAEK